MSKRVTITADIFNDPRLIKLMDFGTRINPVKPKREQEIRSQYRERVQKRELGEPVKRPENRFDRTGIMLGTTLFGGTPNVTEDDIKLMYDAGFDFLLSLNDGEYGEQVLDWCEKYGIPVICNGLRGAIGGDLINICRENPDAVKEYKPHPASIGDDGIDEPCSENIPNLKPLHDAYRKHFPDRFLFSNLLPGMDIKSVTGEHSYRKYVNRFSETVDTDYICADIYPFHPIKIVNRFEMIICLNTYHTLADICRRDGKDFWIYIQSMGRWFSHLYIMTTREMIKWQVYTALCYGCRSILHVSYNPVWGNDAVGMIDYDGNLTEQYLYVKEVNREAKKLIDVMKDYRGLGVIFSDSRKNNPHFSFAKLKQKRSNTIQNFSGIPQVKSVTSESTAIAGFFRNSEGKYAVMAVNCKNIYDPDASQTITVELNGPMKVKVFSNGTLSDETVTDRITVNVNSCEAAFIMLDSRYN